ncbi:MAG: 4-hydroxythreonine-4-phosphate dehydrogenase PdxA, partial [Capnocytophaga ochracea]
MKEKPIKVGISIGDMNGIGLEIILKTFEDHQILELCTPIIFASNKLVSFQKKHFNTTANFQGIENVEAAIDGKLNVLNCWKETPTVTFGQETEEGGKYAFLSLQAAVEALKNNSIDVLVTAPINKNNIQSDAFHFPGHTDYLAQELNGTSLRFMVSEDLKVGLV